MSWPRPMQGEIRGCDFCHCSAFVCFVRFEDFRKSRNTAKAKELLWPRPGDHKFCLIDRR
jgi:hypothetical protein